jgi:PAS domain S-box-containing protein
VSDPTNETDSPETSDAADAQRRLRELEELVRQQCLLLALASASERKYRDLVEATSDWVWETDATGRYTYSNPKVLDILGYEPSEVVGKQAFDFMPTEEAVRVRAIFNEAVAARRPIRRVHNTNLAKNGRLVILETSADAVVAPDGTLTGFRGIDRDVTEFMSALQKRERAEAELRHASKLLETVLNAIPDIIGLQDLNHGVIRYNETGLKLLGLRPDQVDGRRHCYEMLGNDKPCEECATAEVYRTRKPGRVRKYVAQLDAWYDARAYPVLDENGELRHVVEHLRDITREKQAEEEILKYRDRLNTLMQATPIPIFAKNQEGRYLFFNEAYERFFGVRSSEQIGKTVEECWSGEDAAVFHRKDLELMASDHSQVYEHRLKVLGEERELMFHKACFHDASGAAAGIVGVIIDLTEQRRVERARRQLDVQIQQTQRNDGLGTLAGGVAHDFNNLLMTILGNADLAAGDIDDQSPARACLDEIMRAGRRAADLCNQMLAYAGEGRSAIRWLDLNAVAVDMSEALRSSVAKGVEIRFDIATAPLGTRGDVMQLRQALLNLMLNASEAIGPGGGIVEVRTGIELRDAATLQVAVLGKDTAAGEYVFIEVTDSGCGMDADTRARMFDPFFSTKFMGRGLGLAAVLGIVKAHRGVIEVRSEPGQGTSVRILLPSSPKPASGQTQRMKKVGGATKGRILFADDEPSIRDLLSNMLTRSGYETLVASNGKEALALFDRYANDVVCAILDVSMPLMDGFETLRHLKQRAPSLPVILSSGYARDQLDHRMGDQTADGFIQKPYQWKVLSSEIDRLLKPG